MGNPHKPYLKQSSKPTNYYTDGPKSLKFVFAGFLVQYIQGKPIDECINCAHYTAKLILQVSGVTLVGKPGYE
jgi:glucose-6-phosphate dehydrogenase assembly protein OpcA